MAAARLGHYEIQREIGRGGMAIVYLARDTRHNRVVAIKMLPREFTFSPKFRARFEREAKVMMSLQLPGIVPIYDYGEHEGQPYLVMHYMAGGSLTDRLKKHGLSLAEASEILGRIAPVLDEAHRRKLIHRDLKPGNILFDESNLAYLADFGVVKLTEGYSMTITTQGGIVGTPAYMSPEQVMGKDALDGRSDVYALGIIFYQMLAGHVPYQSDTPMGQAMMHIVEPLPDLRVVRPDLPPDAQAIVNLAMAKDRNNRYPTATALASAVATLAEQAGVMAVAPAPRIAGKKTFPLVFVLAGLAILLCVGSVGAGAAYLISSGGDKEPTEVPASPTTSSPVITEAAPTLEAPSTAGFVLPGQATQTGMAQTGGQDAPETLPTLRTTAASDAPAAPGQPTSTAALAATATRTATSTRTQAAPAAPTPASTSTVSSPPTSQPPTIPPPTAEPPTSQPPTSEPPTSQPPTNTQVPPTRTPFPSTNTPLPTKTFVPPTSTLPPHPTNTPLPPTNTPKPILSPTPTPRP